MSIDEIRQQEGESEKEKKGGEGDVMKRLFDHRIVMYSSEVSRKSAQELIARLLALSEEDASKPIRLYLNSPGGDVDAGFAIFDVIRFIGPPVDIICTGLVASAGVVILLASPKERRYSLRFSRFLIHQPSSGAHGDATDIEIEAGEILKVRKAINKIVAEETGQTIEKVEDDTRRNYWMGAEEALKYGLIGKIVNKREGLGE